MTTLQPLNPRQLAIVDFLNRHAKKHRYPPTVREIGRAVGLSSSSTVQNHLNSLEEKGYIHRDPTKSRTVEVVGASNGAHEATIVSLPVIGRVAAGTPILAAENVDEEIAVGPQIAGSDSYALTVQGDSMIEAGIHDGDFVVVKPAKEAPNGTIVVARIDNDSTGEPEVTVKRFYKEKGRIRLQPENSSMEPIYAPTVAIEGVVTAVIRIFKKK